MPKSKHPKLPKTFGKMKGENPFTKQDLIQSAQFSNFSQWFKIKAWEWYLHSGAPERKLDTLAQEVWDYIHKK